MKSETRRINKEKRALLDKQEVEQKSKKACLHFTESLIYKNSKEIMVYMPLGNETDTTYIVNQARKDNKKLIYPVTDEKTGEITPVYSEKDTVFTEGAFGVKEPDERKVADFKNIDVVIVPGIAFDRNGNRVGFGKGCYDKFLVKTDCIKIGFCYSFQLVDEIQSDIYDIKMDYITTEEGIIKI